MFTGMIEEVGKIKNVTYKGEGAQVAINCTKVVENVALGDSIAVNGVCLTVVSFNPTGFVADASQETLRRTSLKTAVPGRPVNLERALQVGSRMGGHIVQGHVDGVGQILSVLKNGDFWTLSVAIPEELRKYISEKGSVSIDGISLTVAKDNGESIKLAVIPHTFAETNLSVLQPGDPVNIEVDVIARYTEKLLKYDTKEDKLSKLLSDW